YLSIKLTQPNTLRVFANETLAPWSYFSNDRVGTDKYGFSILPSGVRYQEKDGFDDEPPISETFYLYNRGQAAFFWTSTALTGAHAYASAPSAHAKGFMYNIYKIKSFTSAIAAMELDKKSGLAVRCIKRP
ncbi:MAG: hypothetical protein ACRCY6_00100, partial [Bacteroidales bacterium]